MPNPTGENTEFKVSVEDVNIADPGIAFMLSFKKSTNDTGSNIITANLGEGITIKLNINFHHKNNGKSLSATSTLSIDTVTDPKLSIIMPFGDSDYHREEEFDFELEIKYATQTEQGENEEGFYTYKSDTTKHIIGQPGIFKAVDTVFELLPNTNDPEDKDPTRLHAGQFLADPEFKAYLGIDFDNNYHILRGKPIDPEGTKYYMEVTSKHIHIYKEEDKRAKEIINPIKPKKNKEMKKHRIEKIFISSNGKLMMAQKLKDGTEESKEIEL